MFLANINQRPSCYSCRWKSPNFCSDITAGDFWGVSKVDPAWNDNKGISVVVVRTKKGRDMLEKLKDTCCLYETDEKTAMSSNGMYYTSTPYKENRKLFFEKLSAGESFNDLAHRFGPPDSKMTIMKARTKLKLKLVLGKVKKIVKK